MENAFPETPRFSSVDPRHHLANLLQRYATRLQQMPLQYPSFDMEEEAAIFRKMINFLRDHKDCFDRNHLPGHVTGSALVTNTAMTEVLLTHHRKLNLWLQLGGHSDGQTQTEEVALREVREESGLNDVLLFTENDTVVPFDLDWHSIPGHKDQPAHIHYDVRFLVIADRHQPIIVSEESHDVRWFSLHDAYATNDERSMHRQFDKLAALKTRLAPEN